MEGQVRYVSARCKYKPFLTLEEGDHFGLLDIVFRLRLEKEKKQQQKELRQLNKQQKKRKRRPENNDEDLSFSCEEDQDELESISNQSSSEDDFATISQKIRYKFTIRAEKTSQLL